MSSAKYYTQFLLTDEFSRLGGNEFSGVVELSGPLQFESNAKEIEAILASNFDLEEAQVTLISWSRLH